VMAPDPRGRKLAAVFVLEDALRAHVAAQRAALDGRDVSFVSRGGEALFAELAGMALDGVVFNPSGPSTKALSPAFVGEVLGRAAAGAGVPAPSRPDAAPAKRSPPLPARNVAEAHLYMDLRGAEPGERGHRMVAEGNTLLAVYDCVCGPDRKPRRFEFTLPEQPPRPSEGYFGPGTSKIVGPGEFVQESARLAKSVPGAAGDLPPDELRAAIYRLTRSIACLDEVIRFIPPGQEQAPASVFRSPADRDIYENEPTRFTRLRLGAIAGAYRRVLGELQRST
jgi:hypothetical protein